MISDELSKCEAFYEAFARWWEEDWSWEGLAEKLRPNVLDPETSDHPGPTYTGRLSTHWEGQRLVEFGGRRWTCYHLPPMDRDGKLCPPNIWRSAKSDELKLNLRETLNRAAANVPNTQSNPHFALLQGVVFPEDFELDKLTIYADLTSSIFLGDARWPAPRGAAHAHGRARRRRGSMTKRPLRPSFGVHDQDQLIEALRTARHWIIRCSSAAPFGSARHQKCEAVRTEIDALAGELTGDGTLFHAKPHGH